MLTGLIFSQSRRSYLPVCHWMCSFHYQWFRTLCPKVIVFFVIIVCENNETPCSPLTVFNKLWIIASVHHDLQHRLLTQPMLQAPNFVFQSRENYSFRLDAHQKQLFISETPHKKVADEFACEGKRHFHFTYFDIIMIFAIYILLF